MLNHSWGLVDANGNPGRYSITVAFAFAYAYKANRISVVAMGNHQISHPNAVAYPAGLENVLSVGATNNFDIVRASSAQGNHIDVSAPGENILSTHLSGAYDNLSGTSMAAPHVSGLASLLKGYSNNLSNDDIRQIIRLSADRVPAMGGANFTNEYGFGRINASSALEMVRDNTLRHWAVTGGTTHSSSGQYIATLIDVNGVHDDAYLVRRHEVRRTVTFPEQFFNIVGVWGRGIGTTGWNIIPAGQPNSIGFGEGFCEVVSSTPTSVTLRTYVYELWGRAGNYMGYYPTTPANVTFAYTVLGNNPTIAGDDYVCYDGNSYQLLNPPQGNIIWRVMGPFSFKPNTPSNNIYEETSIDEPTVYRTLTGSGNGTLLARIGFSIIASIPLTSCPPAAINGPDMVCDNGTLYSIYNPPPDFELVLDGPFSFDPYSSVTSTISLSPTIYNMPNGETVGNLYLKRGSLNIRSKKLTPCRTIVGPENVCHHVNYTLTSGTATSWSVSPPDRFQIVNSNSTSAMVKSLLFPSLPGTLTAVIDGHTVNKSIYTCNTNISGPIFIEEPAPVLFELQGSVATSWTLGSSGGNSCGPFEIDQSGSTWVKVSTSSFNGETTEITAWLNGVPVATKTIYSNYVGSNGMYIYGPNNFWEYTFFYLDNGWLSLSDGDYWYVKTLTGSFVIDYSSFYTGTSVAVESLIPGGSAILYAVKPGIAVASFEIASYRGIPPSYLTAYPNPVSDVLYVEIDVDMFLQLQPPQISGSAPTDVVFDVRLYDGQGNLLRQIFTKGNTEQFNVSNLPAGLYYLHVYDGISDKPEIKQIIVER